MKSANQIKALYSYLVAQGVPLAERMETVSIYTHGITMHLCYRDAHILADTGDIFPQKCVEILQKRYAPGVLNRMKPSTIRAKVRSLMCVAEGEPDDEMINEAVEEYLNDFSY